AFAEPHHRTLAELLLDGRDGQLDRLLLLRIGQLALLARRLVLTCGLLHACTEPGGPPQGVCRAGKRTSTPLRHPSIRLGEPARKRYLGAAGDLLPVAASLMPRSSTFTCSVAM